MLHSAYVSATSHMLHYSIDQRPNGVYLRVWEPKSPTRQRPRPFLFAMNYILETEEEAYDLLHEYLFTAGADTQQLSRRERRGELYVVPDPTENMASA
ncbi:MAG: hypothetical protein ACTS2F_23480 [Thainema sp.]